MYRAGKKKEKERKPKDVRQSPSHIHNKPHGLIAASKHPQMNPVVAEEPDA